MNLPMRRRQDLRARLVYGARQMIRRFLVACCELQPLIRAIGNAYFLWMLRRVI